MIIADTMPDIEEVVVAIKEYYPNGLVTRNVDSSNNVEAFSQEKYEFFDEGRQKMVNEAKMLARFQNTPGVVSVRDSFMENGKEIYWLHV